MGKKKTSRITILITILFLLLGCNKNVKQYNGVNIDNKKLGRNLSKTGYNIGQKGQCVEFVKRFYLEIYSHEMPNSYGHAKDFFINTIKNGDLNKDRNLYQYKELNSIPKGSIIVFKPTKNNPYGHIAIVGEQYFEFIEVYQQNCNKSKIIIYKNNNSIKGYLTRNKI